MICEKILTTDLPANSHLAHFVLSRVELRDVREKLSESFRLTGTGYTDTVKSRIL